VRNHQRWLLGVVYCLLVGAVGWAATHREQHVVLSRFVTSLADRTPNQVHNVQLAAKTINGRWLPPGGSFSFNNTVGSWSSDSGYKRAPVSYDGELVPSWGGGVCQASSTLYNAAVLAGLTVQERHRHRWLARYVAPGRDAAVAYPNIDLRLRNDHPWPVRIDAEVRGNLIEFAVVAAPGRGRSERKPREVQYEFRQRTESVIEPMTVRHPWKEGLPVRRVRNPGKRGMRVLTYRARIKDGQEVSRDLLSDDSYPAMNRLLLTN
jgi:vancomycin resistance protein VanW